MSRIAVVEYNQSLIDICIQTYGNLKGLFALALANDISVTQVLTVSSKLLLPEIIDDNQEVSAYYENRNLRPATACAGVVQGDDLDGIGYMAIEANFIIR